MNDKPSSSPAVLNKEPDSSPSSTSDQNELLDLLSELNDGPYSPSIELDLCIRSLTVVDSTPPLYRKSSIVALKALSVYKQEKSSQNLKTKRPIVSTAPPGTIVKASSFSRSRSMNSDSTVDSIDEMKSQGNTAEEFSFSDLVKTDEEEKNILKGFLRQHAVEKTIYSKFSLSDLRQFLKDQDKTKTN